MPITFCCQHLESKIAAVLLPPPRPITTSFFPAHLNFFVCVPSILRFSALLKHFHGSTQIELLGLDLKNIHIYVCLLVDYSFCSNALEQACKSIDNPFPFLPPHLGLPNTAVQRRGRTSAAALLCSSGRQVLTASPSPALLPCFCFPFAPQKYLNQKASFFPSTHSKLKGLVNRDSTERGRLFSSLALINSSSLGRRVCRPQFSLVCAESGHRRRLPVQTVCVGAGGHRGGERGRKKGSRGAADCGGRGRHSPESPGASLRRGQTPGNEDSPVSLAMSLIIK